MAERDGDTHGVKPRTAWPVQSGDGPPRPRDRRRILGQSQARAVDVELRGESTLQTGERRPPRPDRGDPERMGDAMEKRRSTRGRGRSSSDFYTRGGSTGLSRSCSSLETDPSVATGRWSPPNDFEGRRAKRSKTSGWRSSKRVPHSTGRQDDRLSHRHRSCSRFRKRAKRVHRRWSAACFDSCRGEFARPSRHDDRGAGDRSPVAHAPEIGPDRPGPRLKAAR